MRRVRIVAAGTLTSLVIDSNGSMHIRDFYRRYAWHEPGFGGLWTMSAWKIASALTHFDFVEIQLRLLFGIQLSLRQACCQRIRNSKKKGGVSLATDKRGIARAVEITHPDRQHVWPEYAYRPRVTKYI